MSEHINQSEASDALACIGRTYKYPITRFYDGHKHVDYFVGTCIGYDPRPKDIPPGDYLVMRVLSKNIVTDHYHTVPIKDVREVSTNASIRSKDITTPY